MDDIVWAQLDKFPAWPGRVSKLIDDGSHVEIEWFYGGSYKFSTVGTQNVFAFERGGHQQGDCFVLYPFVDIHPKIPQEDGRRFRLAFKMAMTKMDARMKDVDMKDVNADHDEDVEDAGYRDIKILKWLQTECLPGIKDKPAVAPPKKERKYWVALMFYGIKNSSLVGCFMYSTIAVVASVFNLEEQEVATMLLAVKEEFNQNK